MELGLDRVASVAKRLDLLQPESRVITVAGTNGKGSTVAVLEAILHAAGFSTGAYTSPHTLRFNERIRVAAVQARDIQIVQAFAAIEVARGEISLSYFEFATLAALIVFKESGLDFILLEVGLGGRLDAVNIIDPDVAIITSIALDHQDWLGQSRDEIAIEKAGIVRRNKPAVIAESDPPASLHEAITRVAAHPALFIDRDYSVRDNGERFAVSLWQRQEQHVQTPWLENSALVSSNVAAALQALSLLDIELPTAELPGLIAEVTPLGRRQRSTINGRDVILDVAHNPAAVHELTKFLARDDFSGKTLAVFSVMEDKDLEGMLEATGGSFDQWFVADIPGNSRARSASSIATALRKNGYDEVSLSNNPNTALSLAQQVMSHEDRIVVFGSFFTVAAVLPSHVHDEVQ